MTDLMVSCCGRVVVLVVSIFVFVNCYQQLSHVIFATGDAKLPVTRDY